MSPSLRLHRGSQRSGHVQPPGPVTSLLGQHRGTVLGETRQAREKPESGEESLAQPNMRQSPGSTEGSWELLRYFSANTLLWHAADHSGSLHTNPSSLWLPPQHRTFTARGVSLLKCYLFSFYVFFPAYPEDSPGTIPVSAGVE